MSKVALPLQGANIGRHVGSKQAHRNIAAVRHGVPPITPHSHPIQRLPGVCWQEVNDDNAPVDERDDIDQLFPPNHFSTWPHFDHRAGALIPITMPDPWRVEDQWADLMSHGKAKVQPDRYLTTRVMRHDDLDAPLAVLSWQMVAGAFTTPGQMAEAYRRDTWLGVQWPAVQTAVRDLVRDGITCAYAADTNRPHCPLLRWDDHRVIQQGLDALGFVPGRGRHALQVKVRRTWRVPLNIDGHDGTGALLALA